MFSNSKRLGETRTDFCLWLTLGNWFLCSEVSGCIFPYSFFLWVFLTSVRRWNARNTQRHPNKPDGSPAGLAARRVFFQTTPELWTFKSFTDPFHAETKPHPCLPFASRSVVESLDQQSSSAQSSCFANAAQVTQGGCGFSCLLELGMEELSESVWAGCC